MKPTREKKTEPHKKAFTYKVPRIFKHKPYKKVYTLKPSGKKNVGTPLIYTLEFCQQEVKTMLDYLLTGSEESENIYFISELCIKRGYPINKWSEWRNKFKHDDKIQGISEQIENILETRLAKRGIEGKTNPAMTIFTLKNKYAWKEHWQQDTQPLTQINFNLAILSKDELLKLDATINKATPNTGAG